jgi:hypothetical protein
VANPLPGLTYQLRLQQEALGIGVVIQPWRQWRIRGWKKLLEKSSGSQSLLGFSCLDRRFGTGPGKQNFRRQRLATSLSMRVDHSLLERRSHFVHRSAALNMLAYGVLRHHGSPCSEIGNSVMDSVRHGHHDPFRPLFVTALEQLLHLTVVFPKLVECFYSFKSI